MSSYVAVRDKYAAEAVAIHKTFVPNAGFLIVEHSGRNWTYTDNGLQGIVKYYEKKHIKKFHLTNVVPVKCSIVPYAIGVALGKGKRSSNKTVVYTDRTGAFKLTFSDGSILTLMKWYSGAGSNLQIACLLVGEESTFYKSLCADRDYRKISGKPKNGISTVKQDGNGRIYYEKLKKIQHTPVVHPAVKEVTEDLDNYFENVSEFTKYGMSGVRKVLLVGPPGTGKSSYAYQIAARHKNDMSVVFAANVNAVASHLLQCSKGKVPTIIIWEDAESTGLKHAGSDILNFLDGIDQPQTLKGAYIIMTTNFPEMIDDRIKKRPGRVDRIFEFGVLKNEYALKCAQIYFYGLFPYKFTDQSEEARAHFTRLLSIVTGMSGASIKGLAYSSRLYAAGQKLPITLDLVKVVKDELAEDLSKVDKYAEDVSNMPKAAGFRSVIEKETVTELDWQKLLSDL